MERFNLILISIFTLIAILFFVMVSLQIIIGIQEPEAHDEACISNGYETYKYGKGDFCIKDNQAIQVVFDCKGVFDYSCIVYEVI